ncbi:DUF1190 domain-containing protein [Phreatobacter sp.]|uniref:DUF1190 domain-containing protein n=1 Tax=Phreatobacter sp. TaxID=1966341 RepID=UPI0025CDDF6F|nr:DUF1190 domain-containing protein [Phreatobacter sp.]
MKPVAVVGSALILTAGAIVAYVIATGGDCAGAPVFRSVAACTAGGIDAARCAALMGEADRRLLQNGPVFDMRQQCEDRYLSCQPASGATGFVPRASGFCLRPGPPEVVVPVFGRG